MIETEWDGLQFNNDENIKGPIDKVGTLTRREKINSWNQDRTRQLVCPSQLLCGEDDDDV